MKKTLVTLCLALALISGGVVGCAAYNTKVHTEQGGAKLVVASGGEIEVQSGATFDLQSGATTDFSSGVDLDGGLLDLDANGNTSIQADTDDQIDIEISGADDFQFTANTFVALSGSTVKANTIAETTAGSGVSIDSVLIKDGGVDMTAGDLTMQNDETLSNSYDGTITATVDSAGFFSVLTGNLHVGNDASGADQTLNGEDAYIEGLLEVDGNASLDAIAILGTWLRATSQSAIEVTDDSTITPTGTYQPLAATAGSAGTDSIAGGTAGDLLVLRGPAANTVTLTDTGTLKLGGNRALSANDILILISDGTNWNEIAFANN